MTATVKPPPPEEVPLDRNLIPGYDGAYLPVVAPTDDEELLLCGTCSRVFSLGFEDFPYEDDDCPFCGSWDVTVMPLPKRKDD